MSFCPAVNDSRSFHLSHLLIWLPSSTFAFTLHSLYDEKFLPLLVLLHLHPHSFPTRLPLPTSSSSATSPTFSPLPPSRTLLLCPSVCRPTYVLIVLFDLRVLFLLFLCPYDRINRLFHTRVGYSNARSMSVSLFLFMSLLLYTFESSSISSSLPLRALDVCFHGIGYVPWLLRAFPYPIRP